MNADMKAMELRNALRELARYIVSGGEMPEGRPMACFACPVAVWLTERLGENIGVACDTACYAGSIPQITVEMPKVVVDWISEFDSSVMRDRLVMR